MTKLCLLSHTLIFLHSFFSGFPVLLSPESRTLPFFTLALISTTSPSCLSPLLLLLPAETLVQQVPDHEQEQRKRRHDSGSHGPHGGHVSVRGGKREDEEEVSDAGVLDAGLYGDGLDAVAGLAEQQADGAAQDVAHVGQHAAGQQGLRGEQAEDVEVGVDAEGEEEDDDDQREGLENLQDPLVGQMVGN